MAYIYDIADTWNASGTTFTAIKMNVTDTASAAVSLLMDLQVGGVSKFNVTKAGSVIATSPTFASALVTFGSTSNSGIWTDASGTLIRTNGTGVFWATSNSIDITAGAWFGWSTSPAGTSSDIRLYRDAANTLAQRNGVNAQTSRLYGTYTDASNYRRLTKTMSTGGVAEIKPEGAGTGASGNVLHISGLPTSNPGPGILWNNLGAVVVGT